MKKLLAWCTFALISSASAAFTPTQLAQLIQEPAQFKPNEKYTDSKVNAGTPVYSWVWSQGLDTNVKLQSLTRNSAGWELYLGDNAYTLSKVVPQRKLLAVINDALMNNVVSIYSISSGPFKGHYALDERYGDGSGSLTIQTKAFAVGAANGSEFRQNTPTKLLAYPVYGLLIARGSMCKLPEVSCK